MTPGQRATHRVLVELPRFQRRMRRAYREPNITVVKAVPSIATMPQTLAWITKLRGVTERPRHGTAWRWKDWRGHLYLP